MKTPKGVRTFSVYAAAGLSGLVALALLNAAADRVKVPGLDTVRDFITGNRK